MQGSDVDMLKKRAERFGEVTSTQLGKASLFQNAEFVLIDQFYVT